MELDYSMDNDLSIAYEENSRLRASLEVAESSIVELKLEVSSLQSHADEIGIETQRFAQQLSAEVSSGEQLANEVSVIKALTVLIGLMKRFQPSIDRAIKNGKRSIFRLHKLQLPRLDSVIATLPAEKKDNGCKKEDEKNDKNEHHDLSMNSEARVTGDRYLVFLEDSRRDGGRK
ncbi:hypothetical protein LOK49_LG10G02344 [Camellia lanceoleosa]|uniref:Uncharacterized protein n=1 Tax=Camellia lanceoleosa TaxID=1840588 RepID=A0ACC0G8S6_9ERIC|nr:hypothetical protein LOK49_LG10G02344 [Camellia lanceoleosa]